MIMTSIDYICDVDVVWLRFVCMSSGSLHSGQVDGVSSIQGQFEAFICQNILECEGICATCLASTGRLVLEKYGFFSALASKLNMGLINKG